MKIKKLYAEPEMRLHKLKTSTILQASQGNSGGNHGSDPDPDDDIIFDPTKPIVPD